MRWERRVRHTTTGGATLLLLALIVLCAVAAFLCGGSTGLVVGLGGVVILNGAAYWCGDRVVRAVTRARPLGSGDAPWLRALVIELAGQARMPVPRIAVLDTPIPDALSTGRDPNHATILVTTGLLARLDTRTLRGVLAHELAHIKGRDTLRGAVAMTLVLGSAVAVVVEQVTALVGRPDADTLALLLVAPLAALLLQRALARAREYAADAGSARLPRCPRAGRCPAPDGVASGRPPDGAGACAVPHAPAPGRADRALARKVVGVTPVAAAMGRGRPRRPFSRPGSHHPQDAAVPSAG